MQEIKRDIFEVIDEELKDKNTVVFLMHCVSADFEMGAGIAKAIDTKYKEKKFIQNHSHNFDTTWKGYGFAYVSNHFTDLNQNLCICDLVTKEHYWNKPSYNSLDEALRSATWLIEQTFNWYLAKDPKKKLKIIMPRIGCGLDRLQWFRVKEIVNQWAGFKYPDIIVCYLEN